ncbi:olfactory receptor 8U3-like [Rhinophrynus dorsalis]
MVTYFIIKGITDLPELQAPIFLLVLLIYLITLAGNMMILLLVFLDPQLHTAMYFFLANLSVLDMSCSTTTLHMVLLIFVRGDHTISVLTCIAQVYVFSCLACDELLILTAMSYDRYVAICNPLHYPIVMNRTVCVLLATVSWVLGFLEAIPHVVILSHYTCYRSNVINHFFCDMIPLMQLSCNDTSVLKFFILIEGSFLLLLTPFILTFISYVFIIDSILRIQSSTGRHKAFYTCSSHLTVVILLYLTFVFQYLQPTSVNTMDSNKLFSLFNTAVVPMLNPLIYSLKNKDVKSALRRQLKFCKCTM